MAMHEADLLVRFSHLEERLQRLRVELGSKGLPNRDSFLRTATAAHYQVSTRPGQDQPKPPAFTRLAGSSTRDLVDRVVGAGRHAAHDDVFV